MQLNVSIPDAAAVVVELGGFLNSCLIRNMATVASQDLTIAFVSSAAGPRTTWTLEPGDTLEIDEPDTSNDPRRSAGKIVTQRLSIGGNSIGATTAQILYTLKNPIGLQQHAQG